MEAHDYMPPRDVIELLADWDAGKDVELLKGSKMSEAANQTVFIIAMAGLRTMCDLGIAFWLLPEDLKWSYISGLSNNVALYCRQAGIPHTFMPTQGQVMAAMALAYATYRFGHRAFLDGANAQHIVKTNKNNRVVG